MAEGKSGELPFSLLRWLGGGGTGSKRVLKKGSLNEIGRGERERQKEQCGEYIRKKGDETKRERATRRVYSKEINEKNRSFKISNGNK